MLQVVGLIGYKLKRALRRQGGRLLHGVAQGIAAVADIELVVGLCLAAQDGQRLGAAVQQNGIAKLLIGRKALHKLPPGGKRPAAVEPQAVVAAGLGQHPDLAVPVKDGREGEVKVLLQRGLPSVDRAVLMQLADLDAALAGRKVHCLGKSQRRPPRR